VSRRAAPGLAAAAALVGIGFNAPYAVLTVTFDYPGILRAAPGDVLTRFAEGGPALIATWYGFMLFALVLAPLAAGLALHGDRLSRTPAAAGLAALFGGLAGLAQAFGLSRWVFVVPALADLHGRGDPALSLLAEQQFAMLNLFAGVAVGEHIGQLLTAGFIAALGLAEAAQGRRWIAATGYAVAALIALGTGEGLAIALGAEGDLFSLATIAGYLGLTGWLIALAISLARPGQARPTPGVKRAASKPSAV
jgi:hypothetical protein